MTQSELFTVFPVFLLVDVSASMAGGPIEAVNKALPDIQNEMRGNPMVGEIARVGLSTFSDEARVEETIDAEVRKILGSYARPAPEGSPEWEILYQKTREEVYRRRFRLS